MNSFHIVFELDVIDCHVGVQEVLMIIIAHCLVLFPWTVGARDLIPERQLAEIIELFIQGVYLCKPEKRLAEGTNQSSELIWVRFPLSLSNFSCGFNALISSLFFVQVISFITVYQFNIFSPK